MSLKDNIQKVTANNTKLDKSLLQLKRSWDEVYKLLQRSDKPKKHR